jgi:hypothetical protein
MTIIAGFRCQDGIVVCADTQETFGSAKRNVPKLVFSHGPTLSAEQDRMINHDLALAMCGAGDGPFVDKIASRAWDALRGVADLYEAELIYGITIGGQSSLFQASGPLVNEKSYASNGIGYYLADFLAGRMGANGEHGWLTTRQCVVVAAYILFQAKEHVEGCGGNSHIAVLRESEASGMVDFQLVEHLTEYLKLADVFTGEMLLATADFTLTDAALTEKLESSIGTIKFIRGEEIKKLKEDRDFARSIWPFDGERPEDDLGILMRAALSTSEEAEDPTS